MSWMSGRGWGVWVSPMEWLDILHHNLYVYIFIIYTYIIYTYHIYIYIHQLIFSRVGWWCHFKIGWGWCFLLNSDWWILIWCWWCRSPTITIWYGESKKGWFTRKSLGNQKGKVSSRPSFFGVPAVHFSGCTPLKIDGWKMYSLLKWSLFRGHVSFLGVYPFFDRLFIFLQVFFFRISGTNSPAKGWLLMVLFQAGLDGSTHLLKR